MSKPNLLFIMDDQHRHDYLGSAGAYFLQTPNLDRLAARGMQPGRLGCLGNAGILPPDTTTYYQRLRDAGYRVGCVGKLDLRKTDGYNGRYGDRPCTYSWGFTHPEECEGKMHAGFSATPVGPYTHYLAEKGQLQRFHEDYMRRSADSWVADCRDSPLASEDFEDSYIGRRAAEWMS